MITSKINMPANPIVKHLLVGIAIIEQPEQWVDTVRKYLSDSDRNSYYYGDTIDMLSYKWKYGAMSDQDAANTKLLLLAGVSKLYSNSNFLELNKAKIINPKMLPNREVMNEDCISDNQ